MNTSRTFIDLFNTYLLNILSVPDSSLGTKDIVETKQQSTYIMEWGNIKKKKECNIFPGSGDYNKKVRQEWGISNCRDDSILKFINLIHAIQNLKEIYVILSVVNPNHLSKYRSHF